MSEPLEKPNPKKPESYKPETPKMMSMLEEKQRANREKITTDNRKIYTETPTKKSLEFNFHTANYLESRNFIQRFASAYTYIEASEYPEIILNDPGIERTCVGCSSGGEKHSCKQFEHSTKRCAFFFLFNTVCGNSLLRRRFDGTPTEMQKLTGEADQDCGSDFTADFLFGYTGYEYRKITDSTAFKSEIIKSINAGKPVIARGRTEEICYHKLITGYYGDDLLIPEHIYYDSSTKPPVEKTETPPVYSEIEALYIFGEKGVQRYTLKDALENIRRVMEYNLSERIWDEYLKKLGGWDKFPSEDGLDKASPDERMARAKLMNKVNLYMYNICSFDGGLNWGNFPIHDLYKEFHDPPVIKELRRNLQDLCQTILSAGHKVGAFNRAKIWEINDDAKLSELSASICEEIVRTKEADIELFETIKLMIELLPLSNERMSEYLPQIRERREAFSRKRKAYLETEQRKVHDERVLRLKPLLDTLSDVPPRSGPVEMNLAAMTKGKRKDFELNYPNGLMEIKSYGEGIDSTMITPQQFSGPLKIELRAKLDKVNLHINYARGYIVLCPNNDSDTLIVKDIAEGGRKYEFYGRGGLIRDEFADIEWIIGRKFMAIIVNGELRHISDDYGYIKAFRENHDYTPLSEIKISTRNNSALTVESMRVTEIQ